MSHFPFSYWHKDLARRVHPFLLLSSWMENRSSFWCDILFFFSFDKTKEIKWDLVMER